MRHVVGVLVGATLAASAGPAWAHEEHREGQAGEASAHEAAAEEQTLTGEVVDVFCYLSHGKEGLGQGHAGCAKKCIKSGLPVAIKVGDQLYLATLASHEAANAKLAELAAELVTVRGKVMEQDGQHLIAISHVERAQ